MRPDQLQLQNIGLQLLPPGPAGCADLAFDALCMTESAMGVLEPAVQDADNGPLAGALHAAIYCLRIASAALRAHGETPAVTRRGAA